MVQDDMEEGAPEVTYILKDSHGKIYLAECVDVTEGGLILQVDRVWVEKGVFPDKHVDTRFLEEELGFKIFILQESQRNETLH